MTSCSITVIYNSRYVAIHPSHIDEARSDHVSLAAVTASRDVRRKHFVVEYLAKFHISRFADLTDTVCRHVTPPVSAPE